MRKFFVYAFCRDNNTFYYIGKGSNKRHCQKRQNGIKPPADKNKILILHADLDEETAFDYESKLIMFYGRKDLGTGLLRNMTNGGEGVSGWIPNDSWREKKRKSMTGSNNPFYGKKHTDETKALISAKNKGRHAGSKNPMYNKKLIGPLNPMFGKLRPDLAQRNKESPSCANTKWYTNGERVIRCKEGEQPLGFVPGRRRVNNCDDAAC